MNRVVAITLCAFVGVGMCHATRSAARSQAVRPQAELAVSVRAVVERGLHAELPPHISTLLGLTREESCAVMQGVLRSTGKVEGIDVSEKNHQDVVIFVVDETSKEQTLYLTSPGGALRRMLLVQQGVGRVAKPSKADVEAFRSEKKMWKERMRAGKTGK